MAQDKSIELEVITPERQVLKEVTRNVVIPAQDGELGVLHLRAPLMCALGIGQLRFDREGRTERVFIDGGFAQVLDDKVIVLTSRALPAEVINDEVVTAAEKAVEDHSGFEEEVRLARERAQQRATELRRMRSTR